MFLILILSITRALRIPTVVLDIAHTALRLDLQL